MWRWWIVLGLAACGDNLVNERAEQRSGTRLKLSWYEYPDGARERAYLARIHDAALDRPCELVEWADGVRRCTLEVNPHSFMVEPYPRVVYADPGCTRPLGRSSGFVPGYAFYLEQWMAGEPKLARAFLPGAVVVPQPTSVYEQRDGSCEPVAEVSRYAYFELGRELSPDHFVSVTRTQLATSGRVGHVADLSADGLSIWRGYHDHELDVSCSTEHGPTGQLHCTPAGHVVTHYADPACREPAVVVPSDAKDTRFAFAFDQTTWCRTYFRTGARLEGPIFQRLGGTCVVASIDDAAAFRVGAPLAFPAGSLEVVASPERALHDVVTTFDGISSPSLGLYDSELQARCTAIPIGWYCSPTAYSGLDEVFTEPTCTVRSQVTLAPVGACVPPLPYASSGFDYHRIGPRVIVYGGSDCTPRTPPPGYAWHSVGPALSRDAFAPATLVVDP
jgi:hypothetical protein